MCLPLPAVCGRVLAKPLHSGQRSAMPLTWSSALILMALLPVTRTLHDCVASSCCEGVSRSLHTHKSTQADFRLLVLRITIYIENIMYIVYTPCVRMFQLILHVTYRYIYIYYRFVYIYISVYVYTYSSMIVIL